VTAEAGRPDVIGVAGAGTMGAGIAQLACLAGAQTLLHDPVPEALTRGLGQIRDHLDRGAERGRWSREDAEAATQRLQPAPALEDLAPCGLVIEAAPERLELKQQLFAKLSDGIVSADCVLATNTSSLLVTAVASAATRPERVVGMHFFNPAPLMRLLEVVAGAESSEPALAVARATGEAMGKVVIDAVDGPGFLVNRCSRPFLLEAQRLLTERIADVETIDRICRIGGGFRMGPFELSDLVGVDVGLDVARSFFEQSFGEPRWRPSPIAVKTVAAGRTGRKAGRGYYEYGGDAHRAADPEPLEPGGGDGVVVIAGDSPLAWQLTEAATLTGWKVIEPEEAADRAPPALIIDAHDEELKAPLQGGPQVVLCETGSLAALDPGGAAVGFYVLPPLAEAHLVELTRGPDTAPSAATAAERFFATLGKHTAWVDDSPGLVLGRIVCQLINESAFALTEGVGRAEDIDAGFVHGLNYPRGPLSWADQIGLDHVLSMLDALHAELGDDRYRAAPLLRRLVWSGRLGRPTGQGFFSYEMVRA
jgi:3-hydroxybutyryl-CoA dehydrogenase